MGDEYRLLGGLYMYHCKKIQTGSIAPLTQSSRSIESLLDGVMNAPSRPVIGAG